MTRGEVRSARGIWGYAPPPPKNFTPSEIISGDEIADPQASHSQSQAQSFLRAVPLLTRLIQPWVS